jgi:Tol biopolymer transport system component
MNGKGSELIRIPINSAVSRYEWSLSPDGSQIAISAAGERENTIRVFSLPGGTSREVTVRGWNRVGGSSWAADGKGWFVSSQSAGSEALLHVDKEGRSRVLWKQPASNAGLWGIPSPDGRYLAFPASTSTSNAWMIENF